MTGALGAVDELYDRIVRRLKDELECICRDYRDIRCLLHDVLDLLHEERFRRP